MNDVIDTLPEFLREYDASLFIALLEHLRLVVLSVVVASLIGVPLGFAAWRRRSAGTLIYAVVNTIQTIPSIALFGLMIPLLALVDRGIGALPATIALILYALLPIVRNTHASLAVIPGDTLDAARGMGMTEREIVLSVMLPLAAPGILSGIRLAITLSIGVATVAAYIGAGGLGFFIARGLTSSWELMIVVAALAIALLTLLVDLALRSLERMVAPKHVRGSEG